MKNNEETVTSLQSNHQDLSQIKGEALLSSIGYFLFLFFVMYILFIRPQKKQLKEQEKMLSSIKVGDNVVTIGGILGTIAAIKEGHFILEISKGVRISILRSRIYRILKEGSESIVNIKEFNVDGKKTPKKKTNSKLKTKNTKKKG